MSSLSVSASGAAADAIGRHVPTLVDDSVASRLFAQDPTLWGPDAESESRIRLSWVGLPRSSRPLVGEIAALRESLRRAGPRPTSCSAAWAAPRSHPRSSARRPARTLVVLDSSDPDYVRRRPRRRPRAHRRRRLEQVRLHGRDRLAAPRLRAGASPTPASTRPPASSSSPTRAARSTRSRGPRATASSTPTPTSAGATRALTAFGLVPSGLAGVDVEALLDEAESVADLLADDDDANPALRLGAAMAGTEPAARQARARRRRLRHHRIRRLGRAAHRRVHRQGRHRRAARRRRGRRRTPRCARPPPTSLVARLVPVDDDTVGLG